jgi:hypothetical protein
MWHVFLSQFVLAVMSTLLPQEIPLEEKRRKETFMCTMASSQRHFVLMAARLADAQCGGEGGHADKEWRMDVLGPQHLNSAVSKEM